MKKIRILQISFDDEIKQWEIPAFRGGIISKIGRDNVLFHNHVGDEDFRFAYPLIQYKAIAGKPAILCIEQGVDEIHNFFQNKDWSMSISGRKLEMKLDKLNMNQFTMQVWDTLFQYSIINWLALNNENYPAFLKLTGMGEKISFLENILRANILSFGKGIEWEVGDKINLQITNWNEPKLLPHKQQKLMAFAFNFKTNVFLPDFIGLGKGASFGFGTVKKMKSEK